MWEQIPAIIIAAATTIYGTIALAILLIGGICAYFFREAPLRLRTSMFISTAGLILFLVILAKIDPPVIEDSSTAETNPEIVVDTQVRE